MKRPTLEQEYEYLKEVHSLLCSEMAQMSEDNRLQQTEIQYLRAFIRWKHLENDYNYFSQHAYEAREEDLPFPFLTL